MSNTPSRGEQAPLKKKVAYLGPLGSYSSQVAISTFSPDEWELIPTVTIKDIFDAVQSDAASYGVVPFENSTHGIVTFTLDNLGDRTNSYPGMNVCGEVYLDVHHFLLGRKNPDAQPIPAPSDSKAVPLADLSHVKQLYSQPQGFGQTTKFVGTYLRGVGTIDATSTSRAAELAAADPTGTSAAIAGEANAELNGLDVLARCIEDRDDNKTRFFVIRKDAPGGEPLPPLPPHLERTRNEPSAVPSSVSVEGNVERYKSLVSFTVPHHAPGALADVLDCFKRSGLNLTSINSMPSQVAPFQYLFFIEFRGSRFDDPTGQVKKALESVGEAALGWRFLGSWVNQM